ncbi:hypothetical protein [Trueperella bialowiezensis]|uniref:Uncharacterized protein n=1 Tax=Trueperella bialowiezensis TaxID=312285 RepID=A0A448PFW8_9ACTO|nr:hypothetical protein [Trueperella bialowiezensis]VEI13837.1 Uncharacterised protein [Trueperella bialowiezensis]
MNVTAELAFDLAWDYVEHLHDVGVLTTSDLDALATELAQKTGATITVLKAANRLDKSRHISDV